MRKLQLVLLVTTLWSAFDTSRCLAQTVSPDGFTKFSGLMEYKIYPSGLQDKLADSAIFCFKERKYFGDSCFYTAVDYVSYTRPQLVCAPRDAADYNNIFRKLHSADSLVLRLNPDSIFAMQPPPPFYKKGDQILQSLKVLAIFPTPMAHDSFARAYDARQKQLDVSTIDQDIAAIEKYAKQNNLKLTKLPTGVFYAITKAGSGAKAKAGDKMMVVYTGSTLDGKVFDGNVQQVRDGGKPFEFVLGRGTVIAGWEEAFINLNKGAKGIIIVPSALAYGARGTNTIKPYTILRFDVEVADLFVEPPPTIGPNAKPPVQRR
ncbi:MAG: hypothetical protein RL660_2840 [Bacteroidota bacterium]|jgi:FKBP-type peptidyl-prolyl cis-trans isomerase